MTTGPARADIAEIRRALAAARFKAGEAEEKWDRLLGMS